MSWVIEHSQSRLGDRLVLLAIANHCDRFGEHAWPSYDSIAVEAHLSVRQAKRSIKHLQVVGELVVTVNAGPYGTNLYSIPGMPKEQTGDKLAPPGGDRMSPEGGVTNRAMGGDKSGKKLTRFVTRTILNHKEPSSRARADRQQPAAAARPRDNDDQALDRRLRVAINSAAAYGIESIGDGETIDQFEARVGSASLAALADKRKVVRG
jgi:hypothetical protein